MPNVKDSGDAPDGGLVPLIAAVFGRRLQVPDFGADDDFFGRGGSSFLAALCVADLKKAGLRLAIQDVFLAKTPRAVAERIESPQKVG
ncbi:phosphopantetheine-binding protein [Catenulispora subtropica]|uniref:Carrier domain-containing protein n=1 Tax=Catenulispora subtropica TaxID=450798 RepID=A0ABP5DNG7_9ACTN